MKQKPTIDDLQKILDDPKDRTIFINPDGSITTNRRTKGCKSIEKKHPKILVQSISDLASSY
jgi:hypothetical protein